MEYLVSVAKRTTDRRVENNHISSNYLAFQPSYCYSFAPLSGLPSLFWSIKYAVKFSGRHKIQSISDSL